MATIKIKFRPSSVEKKEGTLFYQVIHKRIARQITTGYKLFSEEWDNRLSEIILPLLDDGRKSYLLAMIEKVEMDTRRIWKAIAALDKKELPYTAGDVITACLSSEKKKTLFVFMGSVIENLKNIGKIRTSETYATTLNSFIRFREGKDLLIKEIDSDLMVAYEVFLKRENVCPNSSSFYMRNRGSRIVPWQDSPKMYPNR